MSTLTNEPAENGQRPHRRTIGWIGTASLAMGGSNQSLFLISVLFAGQDAIYGQGSAAVPLLLIGILLSWAALPGWIELVLMSRNRVGGIAAACSEAFAPYSPQLSAIVGCCYWWGWVPACGLTAILSASAMHAWVLPWLPVSWLAIAIIGVFLAVNLCGVRSAARLAIPIAAVSVMLSFLAAFIPIVSGHVDWHVATTFHLTTPFTGWFGSLTSLMAGLYLIGFAAPAFEAAACHVGETIDPDRNVPRAMFASAAMAGVYFVVLPVVFLGVLGPEALGHDLAQVLGPVFAPLFGSFAKSMAIGFMIFNMFHGTLQPLAGASRTLSQLADDGIFPRFLGLRSKRDVPWAATVVTATAAIVFLLIGDPIWLIAAANFTYLIAVCLPSVAVWLLRRDAPQRERPYRAPQGTIALGLGAATCWVVSAIFGFEQFGLGTVILGLLFAYSGAGLYAWRMLEDRRRSGLRGISRSLHLRVTEAMLAVLLFDGAGYFIAIKSMPKGDVALATTLQDIFVVVALLTLAVGLVLPGLIAQAATRDLTRINARLQHVAFHDDLTGLPNRVLFMDRFKQMIARVQRRTDHIAAVLFLDLDRFKLVNDSLGHSAGDVLLGAVAVRLSRCLRPGDTLARLGGDEFIFLLDGITCSQDAVAVAERILAELARPFTIADREMFASASIGIAVTHTGFDLPDDVLRDADIAMYRAKYLGKQRYVLFAPELLERAAGLLQLDTDLKGALERREFVLYYQPIVSLRTDALIGFEALIRWLHPKRGLLAPEVFIPAAEESGAIVEIGAEVIREAVRQARIWRDAFGAHRRIAVSVNVSARQFSGPGLVDVVKGALTACDLGAEYLRIEVTESAIMANAATAAATLAELRTMGIEVQLDDFGTGYSSLGYLQQLPVDTLKIDRSFISMSAATVGNPQIVRTITSLARSLSMTTTAEGIETREQLEQLRLLDCTNGQGYYFSPPVDAAAASALIANWRLPAVERLLAG